MMVVVMVIVVVVVVMRGRFECLNTRRRDLRVNVTVTSGQDGMHAIGLRWLCLGSGPCIRMRCTVE